MPVQIFTSGSPLVWGELDLPLMGINSDWNGKPLEPPLGFTIAADRTNLWFVATRQAPAFHHPGANPESFIEGLWKYDVAELFLADPKSGAYLEFNLAPNGAWWAAAFTAPRVRSEVQPDFQAAVTAHFTDGGDGTWFAALAIPTAFLEANVCFGFGETANVTCILNSPQQTFHSACKLPGTDPDFHQPYHFQRTIRVSE
jgi:hypothetical protein